MLLTPKSNFIVVGSNYIPHIIILGLKNSWLTRTLIREESSWSFSQNLITTKWENLQKKASQNEKKGKIKSHLQNCIPDPLNWVWKFWKLFAENPFNNNKSTWKIYFWKYSMLKKTKITKFSSTKLESFAEILSVWYIDSW